jgi:methyl coenzyme M reductase subunit D
MKAEIKFYNTETVLNTIMSQDWLQRTAVHGTKMPELVIKYPSFIYMKVISDGENWISKQI